MTHLEAVELLALVKKYGQMMYTAGQSAGQEGRQSPRPTPAGWRVVLDDISSRISDARSDVSAPLIGRPTGYADESDAHAASIFADMQSEPDFQPSTLLMSIPLLGGIHRLVKAGVLELHGYRVRIPHGEGENRKRAKTEAEAAK